MNSRLSYKCMADYDYQKMLQQKQNLAQVQKVLTQYQNHNQNLVHQVHQLIQQNQLLKKQANTHKQNLSPIHKPNLSLHQKTQNYQQPNITLKNTTKKPHILSTSRIPLNHPRDIYLPPQEAHIMNLKRIREARTAHKNYDNQTQFDHFKQKLSEKKILLQKSFKSKSLLNNSQLSLSRNVYIDRSQVEETQQFSSRKPLEQTSKVQPLTFNPIPSYTRLQKRDNSPYNDFKNQSPFPSPNRSTKNWKQPPKSQRSSSAIKIQQTCPVNSFKIPEPKTKWTNLSSTNFQKSKWIQNDQKSLLASHKFYDHMTQSNSGKTKRKKFLNLVSLSVLEEKVQQKCSK